VNRGDEQALRYAREVVGGDPLATFLGIRVREVEPDRAVLSLSPRPHHLNASGRVHGSTLYALADQAAAVAANAGEHGAVLVESKITFLPSCPAEAELVAEARPLDVKRALSLWEVDVISGGERVALAQVLAYHRKRLPR
jgi:uncharacterized protein (TIGR00369 family)